MNLVSLKPKKNQKGQTLIETLVAIFIMVTGVTAALSLAVYAFDSSSNISKQIIGTGLAREGIEAVKNMRDTNWLKGTLSNTCYDYVNGQNDANCYPNWLNQSGGYNFNLSGTSTMTYSLAFDSNPIQMWDLVPSSNFASNFALDFNQFNGSGFTGFYTPDASNPNGTPDPSGTYYYREVKITPDTTPPYNEPGVGPRLQVAVQVWWTDKNCPESPRWPGAGKCSVELDTNLTNWKDY